MTQIRDLVGETITAQQLQPFHPGRCPICHTGETHYLPGPEITTIGNDEPHYLFMGWAKCSRPSCSVVWNPRST